MKGTTIHEIMMQAKISACIIRIYRGPGVTEYSSLSLKSRQYIDCHSNLSKSLYVLEKFYRNPRYFVKLNQCKQDFLEEEFMLLGLSKLTSKSGRR